jgi:hypothetical protein
MRIILKILLPFFIITPLLFLSSCSASKDEVRELEKIPVKDIKQRVNENSGAIETLEASGNISFDSPEQSGSGSFIVKIKKPDTVYVKIEGPFGISIANALITRNNFIYYNVQDNKAIMGPSSDINIGAILRIKVSFDELINGFTGGFEFPEMPGDTLDADSENNMYVIKQDNYGITQKYFIEPSRYTVKRYNSFDERNKSVVEVNYSNYSEESASNKPVNFPSTIRIKNPSNSQSVYVDYTEKQINKKDITFNLKIPKSARIIKWE